MLSLEHLLLAAGIMMFVVSALLLGYDICAPNVSEINSKAFVPAIKSSPELQWRASLALAMLAWAPLLISAAIVFVPAVRRACQ